MQTYDNTRHPVAHIDLYRVSSKSEVEELGIVELIPTHITLIEWPEHLPKFEAACLNLHISGAGLSRHMDLKANGSWITSILRDEEITSFLNSTKWKNSPRKFLEGDASSRRYETLSIDGVQSILMDMPQKPDGPPIKDGKPYSSIAHLAEGIASVVKVNQQLKAEGYSAPNIMASDVDHGLAIIENLGTAVFATMMRQGMNMREPLQTAVALLADMATKTWPTSIPTYDIEAQLIEADLLVSWFWPFIHNEKAKQQQHETFANAWRRVLPLAEPEKPHWVLRDVHSPNLLWLPERRDLQRVGLIDTQDAVLGHPAYDLVSLLQDARVDIDFTLASELFVSYENIRAQNGPFDNAKFSAAFAVLGAQRATKILGIFARLAKRDSKPAYLKHMPRVSRYLKHNLEHPALSPLKFWYLQNMPEALDVKFA